MIIEVGIVCGSAVAVAGMVFVYKLVRLEQEGDSQECAPTAAAVAPLPAEPPSLDEFKLVGGWWYADGGRYRRHCYRIYWHEYPSAERIEYGSQLHRQLETRLEKWKTRKEWADAEAKR